MTNEQLVRQYYDGDEAALEKLYYKNIGLIRGIAKEAAAEFNCLMTDQHHPNQFSAYTKTILDDLCGEGAVELLTRIQSREYDESRAALTTYLYPYLRGRMTRWLEQNIGCMALSKDEMAAVRQVQRLYHVAWKDTSEIAPRCISFVMRAKAVTLTLTLGMSFASSFCNSTVPNCRQV